MENVLADLDYELITYLCKKTRLDNDLIIEAVSYHLSLGTVSNIEKRRGSPSLKSVAQYLTNLGIDKTKIVNKVKALESEIQEIQFQLELAQIYLDENKPGEAKTILDNIHVVDFHPLTAKLKYFLGRYYYIQDDFKQAKQCFIESIKIYENNNYIQPDHLPTCFNTFSTCFYYEGNLEQALKYVNLGLQHDVEKSHPETKYLLLVNKVLYLVTQGESELAFELINQVWNQINKIESTKVRLNFYKFKAQLLKKAKQYNEAIECAKQGIDIARKNKDRNRNFGLLIVLGTIYLEQSDFQKAETCFKVVISFEDFRYPRRLFDAHVYLGILQSKNDDWAKAESHFSNAQQISEEFKIDVRRSNKLLIVYGNVLRQQAKYDQAVRLYQLANQIARKKKLPNLLFDGLFQLLKCYQVLGDHKSFNKTNLELFQLQEQLHQQDEVNIYENAGPSFTTN